MWPALSTAPLPSAPWQRTRNSRSSEEHLSPLADRWRGEGEARAVRRNLTPACDRLSHLRGGQGGLLQQGRCLWGDPTPHSPKTGREWKAANGSRNPLPTILDAASTPPYFHVV